MQIKFNQKTNNNKYQKQYIVLIILMKKLKNVNNKSLFFKSFFGFYVENKNLFVKKFLKFNKLGHNRSIQNKIVNKYKTKFFFIKKHYIKGNSFYGAKDIFFNIILNYKKSYDFFFFFFFFFSCINKQNKKLQIFDNSIKNIRIKRKK